MVDGLIDLLNMGSVDIYIYIYMCVCVCVYVHIYIYIYVCVYILQSTPSAANVLTPGT